MTNFTDLTDRGKVRRLRALAMTALEAFPLHAPSLKFIQHGENTTFRVDALTDSGPDSFLLKLHRPGYQDEASIRSEFLWLQKLYGDGLAVPEPIFTSAGEPVLTISGQGVEGTWHCSMTRWVHGRFMSAPRAVHFERLGRLMATLHQDAGSWAPPKGFTRGRWDWEGLFGDDAGFALPAADVWDLLPPRVRPIAEETARDARGVMESLGESPEVFGLIHADLHFGNTLFSGNTAIPIDFDDSGFAHWVYDIAVPISDHVDRPDWKDLRDAMFAGYQAVQPLPRGIDTLATFLAARHVSLLLWGTDMAQHNEYLAASMPGWYDWTLGCLDTIKRE